MGKGVFIAIEGSAGSGRTTQLNLLKERLKAIGYDVASFDFPGYSSQSSYFIKQYLSGNYGNKDDIGPFTATLFFALDRYETAKSIKQSLKEGKVVVAINYVGANMAREGAKLNDKAEQRGFFVWDDNLEYRLLDLPRPDVSLFMRIPAELSQKAKSAEQDDLDEAINSSQQLEQLKRSLATFDTLCELFPKDFIALECSKAGKILEIPQINDLLWEKVKPLLPADRPNTAHSAVVTIGRPERPRNPAKHNAPDSLSYSAKQASFLLRLRFMADKSLAAGCRLDNWSSHGYDFYTPKNLPPGLVDAYKGSIIKIAKLNREIEQKLSLHLERSIISSSVEQPPKLSDLMAAITPLCAVADFEIPIKKRGIMPLARKLLDNEADELQWAAKQLYVAAKAQWPADFKEPLESSDGAELATNIIAKLAEEYLSGYDTQRPTTTLLEARPRLEFDLLAESIYPYSSLSMSEIAEEVSNWPYLQKLNSLKAAASKPDVLKKMHYKFDILSDHLAFCSMAAVAEMSDIQLQAFSPRFGFEVPEIIETAGLDDLYNSCFDESLKLYSLLQSAGQEDVAEYATLLGHKFRWQFNINGASLRKLILSRDNQYDSIANEILEKVLEAHPLMWEIISGQPFTVSHKASGKNRVKSHKKRPPKSK